MVFTLLCVITYKADNYFNRRFKNNTFSKESNYLFIKTAKDWFQ